MAGREDEIREKLAAFVRGDRDISLDLLEDAIVLALAESDSLGDREPGSDLLTRADLLLIDFREGRIDEEELDEGLTAVLRLMQTTVTGVADEIISETTSGSDTFRFYAAFNSRVDQETSVSLPA